MNLSPHPEERSVSKDEGASSACWMILRDGASHLPRMRPECDKNQGHRHKAGHDVEGEETDPPLLHRQRIGPQEISQIVGDVVDIRRPDGLLLEAFPERVEGLG